MTISWMRALETQGVASPAWVPSTRGNVVVAQSTQSSAALLEREQVLVAREHQLQTQMREIEALRQRYEGGIKALDSVKAELVTRTKEEATEIAFAVGRELAQRELATTALPDMVSTLLSDLNEEKATVRMAPKDAEKFRAQLSSVDVVADETLESGSAIVVGKEATIEASFQLRTQRIREALGLQPLKIARSA